MKQAFPDNTAAPHFATQKELETAHERYHDPCGPLSCAGFEHATGRILEQRILELENVPNYYAALSYSSGMAAIHCVMANLLAKRKGPIVLGEELYKGANSCATYLAMLVGVPTRSVTQGVKDGDSFVFVEDPSNPTLRRAGIPRLAIACKDHDVPLVVDNSLLTPMYNHPLVQGADVTVYSGTKGLCGHAVVCGFAVANKKRIREGFDSLIWMRRLYGTTLGQEDAHHAIRTLHTLKARMAHASDAARDLHKLLDRRQVDHTYPGNGSLLWLPGRPGFEGIPYADSFGGSATTQYAFSHGVRLSLGYENQHFDVLCKQVMG